MSEIETRRSKAFILNHIGLGDEITIIGMARYFLTLYEKIFLVCDKKNELNVKLFFKDDYPKIEIYVVDLNYPVHVKPDDLGRHFGFSNKPNSTFEYNGEIYDLINVGMYGPINSSAATIPFNFYDDLKLPYNIFWDYSHIPDTEQGKELYEFVKDIDYIIIHANSSYGISFTVEEIENKMKIDRNSTLILDIEKNVYDINHPFYEKAQKFVMQPILFYKDSLINASQIFVSDSCLFCMAIQLDIKTEKCYIIERSRGYRNHYSYIFSEKYNFNPLKTRKFTFPF